MHAAWETRLAYSPAGDEFLTSRRLLRRAPPLVRGTAWLLRQVTGIDIPPLDAGHNTQQVHHDDDHDHRRCYSKFSIVLDLILNLVFVVVGVAMLGVSGKEDPPVPLRLWACGYVVSCVVHIVCVVVRRNEELGFGGFENWGRIEEHIRGVVENACPVKFMASLVWWVAGFWWVIPPIALPDAPRLYWLCAAFLLCDIMAILVALAATCLYFLSVCCCMPCMLAILPALTDTEYSPEIKFATVAYLFHTSTLVNEAGISNSDRKRQANTLNNLLDGATEEEINSLPKFKFRRIDDFEIVNSQLEESSGGAEAECDAIAPNERVISQDHNYLQECGICLEAYQNGEELRQLPCHHQFHSACIDTWLRKRTICPMCKFDMLKPTYGRYGGTMV